MDNDSARISSSSPSVATGGTSLTGTAPSGRSEEQMEHLASVKAFRNVQLGHIHCRPSGGLEPHMPHVLLSGLLTNVHMGQVHHDVDATGGGATAAAGGAADGAPVAGVLTVGRASMPGSGTVTAV